MAGKRLSADEMQDAFIAALPASGEVPYADLANTLDTNVLTQWHNLKHTGRIKTRTEHDEATNKVTMYVSRA